ncbi:MAG: hypothetical protein II053_03000 [Bacteroidales bacterium]|nr:hypothetical protein [Bacteroidales bacterium]
MKKNFTIFMALMVSLLISARCFAQDPLAAKYPAFSPYAYCAGDPVNFVDPDGNNPIVSGLLGGAIDYGFQYYAGVQLYNAQ